MAKPVQKRTYLKQWEVLPEFKDWIRKSYDDPDKAHCKYCNQDLRSHKSDLDRHVKTPKHQRIVSIKAKQKSMPLAVPKEINASAEQQRKRFELRLALFTAVKSTFRWVILHKKWIVKTHKSVSINQWFIDTTFIIIIGIY